MIRDTDVRDGFISNVLNLVTKDMFGSNRLPYFSGSAYKSKQSGYELAVKNPPALPQNDLQNTDTVKNNIISSISGPTKNDMLTGSSVCNAISAVVARLGDIRKFHSEWYHRYCEDKYNMNADRNKFIASTEGIAAFKQSLPALQKYSKPADRDAVARGWNSRSSDTGRINSPTVQDSDKDSFTGLAHSYTVRTFMTKVFTRWNSIKNTEIKYTLYTCHDHCHANCHGSRGRR